MKTRAGKDAQRAKWRDAKRKQRKEMSSQKKRRINEKRRQKYALKKANVNVAKLSPEANPEDEQPGFKSDSAKRKAISRAMRVLPKSSKKFVQVVTTIIEKSTPRKKDAFKKLNVNPKRLEFLEETSRSVKETLQKLKTKRNKKDNRLRQLVHQALICKGKLKTQLMKEMSLSRKVMNKLKGTEDYSRKVRCDKIHPDVVRNVAGFFQRSDISRVLPVKSSIKKDLIIKKALESSMKTSYERYLKENEESKISFSAFVKLRPKNILPMDNHKYLQCLCEYCLNVQFKVESLNRFCISKGLDNIACDKYAMSNLTLCENDDKNILITCIDRKCSSCGLSRFDRATEVLNTTHSNTYINWQSWKLSQDKHMEFKIQGGSVAEMLTQLRVELETFPKHLFNASWQAKEFEQLKNNVPQQWVLLCMDFAKNYVCRHQDEAQGAHWHYNQVTIHPVIAYHRCLEKECNLMVHRSIIFISEDHKHDHHAVQFFVTKSNEYLTQNGLNINRQIHFSDGAPTQYKAKTNFVDMSMVSDDFGFPVEKHYFGSRHGKGPCDAEAGVLKKSASVAVSSRNTIISNAADFFDYATRHHTLPKEHDQDKHCHSIRTFIFVKENEIQRKRQIRTTNIKPIQGTRNTHCFRGVMPYVTLSRERSCFCTVCTGVDSGTCKYHEVTGDWNVSYLKRGIHSRGVYMHHICKNSIFKDIFSCF